MKRSREPVPVETWLWAARLVKSRAQAGEAIAAGHVLVGGQAAAAETTVRLGDTVELQVGEARIVVDVRGLSTLRGPERIAQQLYAESAADDDADEAGERRAAVPRVTAAQVAGVTKQARRAAEDSANSRRVAPRGGGGRGR